MRVLACAAWGTRTGNRSDRELIGEAIAIQMKDYPQSTLKAVYKHFFQDAFGPGHLMSDADDAQERMSNYLRNECELAKTDVDPSPYFVKSGWHGRFYRVNLSVINEGKVPFDVFLSAFMESAKIFVLPEIEDWSKEWSVIEDVFKEGGYEGSGFSEDSTAIRNLLDNGEYVSHHSEQYEKAYHPHYRLIEKSVFEDKILPLLR